MAGTENSVKGVLADSPIPNPHKIIGEPMRESLINIHRLISGNLASVTLNLRGGQNGHLTLTIAAEDWPE